MNPKIRKQLEGGNLGRTLATGKQTMKQLLLKYKKYENLSPIERFRRDGYFALITRNLNLTEESEVWDFGGYTGEWSNEKKNLSVFNYHLRTSS